MKKFIIMLSLAGAMTSAFGQISVRSAVESFYASEEWQRAFVGYYGVVSGTEPGIPEDQTEREALANLRDVLRAGTDESVQAASTLLETLISGQRTKGVTTSPMIMQIAGTLQMRLAELARSDADRQRFTDRALAYLRTAVDPNTGFPNFLRAHKNLANLLFRADRSAEARDHFIKAIELGDRDAVTFGLLGAIYLEESKLVAAESALRNSLMINPKTVEFKQLLGQVLLQQERYNEAREIFTELLQMRPNETNFWMAQANAFIALEQIEEAAKNLEIVRLMGKSNAASLLLLGDVYMNKDMTKEAQEAYLEAVGLDPSESQFERFVRAAESLANFGAYDEAMGVVEAIASSFGDRLSEASEISLLSIRSEINLSLGKTEEATANLEDLLRKDPFNARALLSLARYYSSREVDDSLSDEQQELQERRNQQQALIYYDRAQNLQDTRAQVRAFIGEAQLRVQRNELPRAAELLEQAQNIQYQDYIQAYLEQVRAAIRARRG